MTRLERYRQQKSWTQQELAARLQVGANTISRYESGQRRPSRPVEQRLKALTHGEIHAGNFDELVECSPEHGSCDAKGVTEPASSFVAQSASAEDRT